MSISFQETALLGGDFNVFRDKAPTPDFHVTSDESEDDSEDGRVSPPYVTEDESSPFTETPSRRLNSDEVCVCLTLKCFQLSSDEDEEALEKETPPRLRFSSEEGSEEEMDGGPEEQDEADMEEEDERLEEAEGDLELPVFDEQPQPPAEPAIPKKDEKRRRKERYSRMSMVLAPPKICMLLSADGSCLQGSRKKSRRPRRR